MGDSSVTKVESGRSPRGHLGRATLPWARRWRCGCGKMSSRQSRSPPVGAMMRRWGLSSTGGRSFTSRGRRWF